MSKYPFSEMKRWDVRAVKPPTRNILITAMRHYEVKHHPVLFVIVSGHKEFLIERVR
jgi:hypothetical protein